MKYFSRSHNRGPQLRPPDLYEYFVDNFWFKSIDLENEQYGLLAEEVAKAAPDLVRLDEEGKPFSVHYEQMAPMLLNEMQKLAARVGELEVQLAAAREGTDR